MIWIQADEILKMEIRRQNNKLSRSTRKIPNQVRQDAILAGTTSMCSCPPGAFLDLHLSLNTSRRVNNDSTVDFGGCNY